MYFSQEEKDRNLYLRTQQRIAESLELIEQDLEHISVALTNLANTYMSKAETVQDESENMSAGSEAETINSPVDEELEAKSLGDAMSGYIKKIREEARAGRIEPTVKSQPLSDINNWKNKPRSMPDEGRIEQF